MLLGKHLLKIRHLLVLQYKLLFDLKVGPCRPLLLPYRHLLKSRNLLKIRYNLFLISMSFWFESTLLDLISISLLPCTIYNLFLLITVFFYLVPLCVSLIFIDLVLPLSWYYSVVSFSLSLFTFHFNNIYGEVKPPILRIGTFIPYPNFYPITHVFSYSFSSIILFCEIGIYNSGGVLNKKS